MTVLAATYICEGCKAVQTILYDKDEVILPVIRCGSEGICLGSAYKVEVKEE